MIKTYYLAKILHHLHIPSFKSCALDKTARVASGAALTKVKLGRYSYIGGNTHITDANVGSFCSIGGNCGIGGGMHPMGFVSTSPAFLQGRNILKKHFAKLPFDSSKTVEIGHDVWIGEGVYIMSGVKIGTGAVIGAHSVVTKDVAPYAVAVGVPAKEIRKRFDDDTIQRLLELRWWDWPNGKLENFGETFSDPERFFEKIKKEGE